MPLSGADGAAILLGATQGARAGAISELAALFKADLSGQDAEAILGPESVLSEGNRQSAITALARARRFGPSIGEDAALALKGTTQGARAGAIGELATYLRDGMSAQSIAAILGDPSVLSEGNRYSAIISLIRAGKLHSGLAADELALILQGMTGQTRTGAASQIAGATRQPSAPTRAGDPAPTPPAASTPTSVAAAPGPSGGASQPLSPQQMAQFNASIDAKLARLSKSAPPAYFFATDNWLDLVNAAFRGNSGYRENYDGYYFGGLDYRLLAVKRLVGARRFVQASKGDAAQHAIAESDRYSKMMHASWGAANAAAADSVSNAAEIQRWASTVYSSSKIAVLCGSAAISPAAAAAFERVYSVTDFGIDWSDSGFTAAARQAVVDQSTGWLLGQAGIKSSCIQMLATDRLFLDLPRRLETIVRSPEFSRTLGDIVAASLASARRGDAAPIANLIIRGITGGSAVALPPIGTSEMRLVMLGYPFSKLIESIDSATVGFTQKVWARRDEQTWTVLADPGPMTIASGHSKGLRSAVFENKTTNQCAIVFGGTEFSDLADWGNNFSQWLGGIPSEYVQGADFTKRAIAKCVNRKIVIAGHSLGGGIAQYAYLQTGASHLTYTFNPAGLSQAKAIKDAIQRQQIQGPSGNVVTFVANAYDPSSATNLGKDAVSIIPGTYTLGVQVSVPVYSWSPTPHFIAEMAEGLGIQRKYCLDSPACK